MGLKFMLKNVIIKGSLVYYDNIIIQILLTWVTIDSIRLSSKSIRFYYKLTVPKLKNIRNNKVMGIIKYKNKNKLYCIPTLV